VLAISVPAHAQTQVSQAQAEAAMAQLGLDRSQRDGISFSRSRFSDGVYVFSDVVFHNPEPDAPVAISGGKGEAPDTEPFQGADLHVEQLSFMAPRLDASGDLLIDGIVLEGALMEGTQADVEMRLDRVELLGPNPALSRLVGLSFILTDEEMDNEEVELGEDPFDSFRVTGLRLSDPTGSNGDVDALDMRLADFRLEHDAQAGLGLFSLNGFELSAVAEEGPVEVSLREVRISGANTETFGDWMEAAQLDDPEPFLNSYFNTLFLDPARIFAEMAIHDIRIEAPGISMGLNALTADNVRDGELVRSVAVLDNLHITPDTSVAEGQEIAASLAMLGYDSLNLHGRFTSVYDPANGRVSTDGDNYYELDDGFRLSFTSDVSGYDALAAIMSTLTEVDTENPEVAEQVGIDLLSSLFIHGASITIEDLSMLERVSGMMAQQQGLTTEQARAQIGGMAALVTLGLASSFEQEFLADLNGALSGFVREGGALTIALAPDVPRSIAEMMTPEDKSGLYSTETMGLSVEHNPR